MRNLCMYYVCVYHTCISFSQSILQADMNVLKISNAHPQCVANFVCVCIYAGWEWEGTDRSPGTMTKRWLSTIGSRESSVCVC